MSAQEAEFQGSKEKAGISQAELTLQMHAQEEEAIAAKQFLLQALPNSSHLGLTEQAKSVVDRIAQLKEQNAALIQVLSSCPPRSR